MRKPVGDTIYKVSTVHKISQGASVQEIYQVRDLTPTSSKFQVTHKNSPKLEGNKHENY
jgi:hypothetical protein